MYNSEFNKLMRAYSSIIFLLKLKIFNESQVNLIINLLKKYKKMSLKFFKMLKKYVLENNYKGYQFTKDDWNNKIKPILDLYCKIKRYQWKNLDKEKRYY